MARAIVEAATPQNVNYPDPLRPGGEVDWAARADEGDGVLESGEAMAFIQQNSSVIAAAIVDAIQAKGLQLVKEEREEGRQEGRGRRKESCYRFHMVSMAS